VETVKKSYAITLRQEGRPMPSGTRTLRLIRRTEYRDLLRAYKIYINGTQVGAIARDSVLDIEVPSGPFTLEARLDWGRSRPTTIQAAPDQKIEIEVSNNWGVWLAIWAVTFGFRSYLKLTQLPASATP
jgi:hypothetical protein